MWKRGGLNAASHERSRDRSHPRGWQRHVSGQRSNVWPTSSAPAAGRFHAFRRRQPAGPLLGDPVLLAFHLLARRPARAFEVRALALVGQRAAFGTLQALRVRAATEAHT